MTATNGKGMSRARVAIVGAGFSGLGMAIQLKRRGIDDFVVLERSAGIGGTWWSNTYPGCRCDTPSRLYSFTFAPNPDWSATYAPQPEILAYLQRCAQREGVLEHVRLGVELTGAQWNEAHAAWDVETSDRPLRANVLVAATGALSEPKIPDFPGLERFSGTAFHSAEWDHDQELSGKRVAVIGTGASAVQIVPAIAPEVAQLHVFQRSAAWIPPHTGREVSALERRFYRALPLATRVPRGLTYFLRELLMIGWTRSQQPTKLIELICRAHLRRQVKDPDVRRALTPDYHVGCKRLCPSNAFYPAFNRTNVELVTDQIAELRERSIVTADSAEREVDAIVYATGFHVTDAPLAGIIRGRDGRTLAETWDGSPRAYLGTTVPRFPNLFLLLGPNTGNLSSSVVLMVESQVRYVLACIDALGPDDLESIEVRQDVADAYNNQIDNRSAGSVWLTGGCDSWYLDRNGRNSTLWPDVAWRFDQRTRRFDIAEHRTTARGELPVKERRVSLGGFATRLVDLEGEGPAYILIHGLTDCGEFWNPTLQRLAAAGRRAVVTDLPGHAQAAPLGDGPVLPQLDHFVDALLDHVGGGVVVGHSLGGCLALRLAQRDPEGLVGVVATPPSGFDMPALSSALSWTVTRRAIAATGSLPLGLRRRVTRELWRRAALGKRDAASPEFLDVYSRYACARITETAQFAGPAVAEMRSGHELEQITVPLLLVWGDADRLANPRAAQRILDAVPDARLVELPGVGHCPPIEEPDRFTNALLEFAALEVATA